MNEDKNCNYISYDELSREQLIGILREMEHEKEQAPHVFPQHGNIVLNLLNSAKLGMVVINRNHRAVEANQSFADMLGYSQEEILKLHTWDWEAVSSRQEIEEEYADKSRADFFFETQHRKKDGTLIDVEVNGIEMMLGDKPEDQLMLCFVKDISRRKLAEKKLMESEMRLRAFIENSADMIYILNSKREVTYISGNCERLLGWHPAELSGSGLLYIIDETDRDAYLTDVDLAFKGSPNQVCEYKFIFKDSHLEWFSVRFSSFAQIGGENVVICNLRNINNRKMNQERLEYLSMHDQLTGIYNRTYFNAVLQGKDVGLEQPVSVIVLDFDELKKVNDNYGHAVGDEVLKACTEVIKGALRKNDVFARVGGDEFNILLSGATEEIAEIVLKRIYEKLEEYNKKSLLPEISISAGISVCKELFVKDAPSREIQVRFNTDSLENAIKRADERMYITKREKKQARKG